MQHNVLHAAQSRVVSEAALAYAKAGLSVIPLSGKRPALSSWKPYQSEAATPDIIQAWDKADLLENVGIVCGDVSKNLVVLDLDGPAAYPAFAALLPELTNTFTVKTGSGKGYHVYWFVENLPESIKAMDTPIGHLEICANGRQVVAPPSVHPDTGQAYVVEKALDVQPVEDIHPVIAWLESFRVAVPPVRISWRPPTNLPAGDGELNPDLVQAIQRHFEGHGFKRYGEWLHGRCIYPERHSNGDRHASFGFNTQSGYGYCYRCGTILARDICDEIGIRPEDHGGLIKSTWPVIRISRDSVPIPDVEETLAPEPEVDTPGINDLKLPAWLSQYVDWAGATGNQTPLSFHLAAGLWLLSTAVGRRLYGAAPWGVKLYPNLYLMLVASTTYYRKSTAYKLAERIAREAVPHMLMPTPGSPERFQEALAGRLPFNFDKLSRPQQERFKKAQPFAAQRGLLKDEVAGLFGSMNRRDYMAGMKDLLMELYDCPDYSDKDTQSGLTIVENAALSILGVTTPAGLSAAVSDVDWANGLLIRFALLTPEPNYQERPAPDAYQAPPSHLIQGLRQLHEKLPMPETSEDGTTRPLALEATVQCWDACQAYGNRLRQLCNPQADSELDERLKGVYGRLHVQAFKVAQLMATLDWCDSDALAPTITEDHWATGKAVAELWRGSAHRLLDTMAQRGDAQQEQTLQRRMLNAFKSGGMFGRKLRDVYRNLHIPAKQARQIAQDLERAGLLLPVDLDGAEAYVLRSMMSRSV